MWIRSQSRELLVKVTSISVYNDGDCLEVIGTNDSCNGEDDYWILGEYKSYEQAIKVLDEIQKCILGSNKKILTFSDDGRVSGIKNTNMTCDFYQMPEE